MLTFSDQPLRWRISFHENKDSQAASMQKSIYYKNIKALCVHKYKKLTNYEQYLICRGIGGLTTPFVKGDLNGGKKSWAGLYFSKKLITN